MPLLLFEGTSPEGLPTYQTFFTDLSEVSATLKPWYCTIDYALLDAAGTVLHLQTVTDDQGTYVTVRTTGINAGDDFSELLEANLKGLLASPDFHVPPYDAQDPKTMVAALTGARGLYTPIARTLWNRLTGQRSKDPTSPSDTQYAQGIWRIRPWHKDPLDRSFFNRFS